MKKIVEKFFLEIPKEYERKKNLNFVDKNDDE